jgi:hypothetical protein
MKLKSGDVIPVGTKATVLYMGEKAPSMAILKIDYQGNGSRDYQSDPIKTAITGLHKYLRGYPKPPTTASLERMSDAGLVSTPTGQKVEPDGYGSDDAPSWLLVMGLV